MKIGIIGYGSMGKILLWIFSESGLYDRDCLLVSCMPGFIASLFDVICTTAENHTDIPRESIVKMVLK